MPRIVDKTARRAEIIDAYLLIVAREGARAATSRAVATELGVATGALWNYFSGFDDLLTAALERTVSNTTARIRLRTSGKVGEAALSAALREILPLDKVSQQEAAIAVAFWGRVATEPNMGRIQVEVEATWRDLIVTHVEEAVRRGEFIAQTPILDLVDTLLVLCTGQQVEYVVRTSVGVPSRQWSLIEHVLAPWRSENTFHRAST